MFVPSLSKGKECLSNKKFTDISQKRLNYNFTTSEKVEAIENIEFGRVGKVFLR